MDRTVYDGTMVPMRTWGVVALLVAFGCGSESVPIPEPRDAGSTVPPDAGRPVDDCHTDCFGFLECGDGEVSGGWTRVVPGCEWPLDATCRTEFYSCAEGCRLDGRLSLRSPVFEPPLVLLCEESRPRAELGDACASDDDCRATAVWRPGSRPEHTYLRCGDAGACGEREPPSDPDFMTPCTPPYERAGAFEDEACSGGWCWVRTDDGCADRYRAGCTVACTDDWECPPTARCDELGVCVTTVAADFPACASL